ncbi:MAG: hypothetical protein HW386_652 [Gammaproteobacteria bacterium]|nr:hypothetical protein [Gammaproteobacteria bacterium]
MKISVVYYLKVTVFLCLALHLVACANLGSKGDPRDPFEGLNRGVYSFNEKFDQAVMSRLISFYQAITPDFLDRGITNFFSNIDDIVVVINDFLQFKIGQAFSDITRFVFNSTLGIGGLFDVSTTIGYPKHNEDFGQTLGKWGFGSGPYLVVPVLGPSTFRDAGGYAVANAFIPPLTYIDSISVQLGVTSLDYVDFKADMLTAEQLLAEAALDKYEFTKNAYFELRENLIHDREDGGVNFEELDL